MSLGSTQTSTTTGVKQDVVDAFIISGNSLASNTDARISAPEIGTQVRRKSEQREQVNRLATIFRARQSSIKQKRAAPGRGQTVLTERTVLGQ